MTSNDLVAVEDSDLDQEISLKAELSQTGLTVKAKVRGITALSNIVGDWVALKGAVIRRKRRATELEMQIDEKKQALLGAIELDELEANRIARREAIESMRKQDNRTAVGIEMVQQVLLLPPPTSEQEAADDKSLDQDWLDDFARKAERTSDEERQRLWARVLAGEIRAPGSFSRQTLRIIAELDKETAEYFQKFAEKRLSTNRVIPDTYGLEPAPLRTLMSAGLVYPPTGTPRFQEVGDDLFWHEKGWLIKYTPKKTSLRLQSQPMVAGLYELTPTGREISSLFKAINLRPLLEELVRDYFPPGGVISLIRIDGEPPDAKAAEVIVLRNEP